MSYNGSGTFQINTTGQPVVTGTVISSTAFNALTADLATGLSTAITKDGQTATTARIPFAAGISSTLVTDSSSTSTGSIITAGGIGVAKAAYIGTTLNVASTTTLTGVATLTANPVLSAGTANGVTYLNGSKSLTSGSAITFDGTNFATTGTASASKLIPTGSSVTGNGLYLPAANALGLSTNGTNAVYIDASQNVGIGRTPTNFKFEVAGKQWVQDATLPTTYWGNTLSDYMAAYYDTSTKIGYLSAEGTGTQMVLRTVNTERMRIDSSGNVGIGTNSPSSRLTIKQSADAGAGGLTLVRQANTNNWQAVVASTNDLYLIYNGTDRGYFSNSTGAYTSISDRRLKKNIVSINYGLNEILALRSVSYNMNEQEDTSVKTLGFIAQEVQEVLPESVFEMRSGMFGMDKSAIVPVLVKAIQEQQAIITVLTARITALEAK